MSEKTQDITMPLLPLRDVVVYPHMVIPLFVGRKQSIKALDHASKTDKKVILATQKSPTEDAPKPGGIYEVGTIANILQLLKLPDGTVKVLVEGLERGQITEFIAEEPCYLVNVDKFDDIDDIAEDKDLDGLTRSLLSQFEQYTKLNKKVPQEIFASISSITDPIRLIDTIAAHMSLKIDQKQQVLEIAGVYNRVDALMEIIESEIDVLQVEKKIRSNIKKSVQKNNREYYLNEQIKAIQKELTGSETSEVDELLERLNKSSMSRDAREKCEKEINKLKRMSPMAPEATVSRNYIESLLDLPWGHGTRSKISLKQAEEVLEEEHYGLEKVKERILEYLAVQKRVKKVTGPVLCLVGPPGVGKTSLGKSIARAVNRKFVRMALGGVRDEAEIRGHRKTYIGAMPGRVLQKLTKVGVNNPVFLLDEIDKMASDFRGDPASALLELLDPEQNKEFNDHYIEVDYDLSDVMFVATANSLDIPGPLLDRMEVIRLAGYTEEEKLNIATKYLIPHTRKEAGLKDKELTITDSAVLDVVRLYTKEAGVRGLEREFAKIARKVTKELLVDKATNEITIKPENLEKYLGAPKYRYGKMEEKDRIGQVMGLAWTQVGGEILTIEAATMPGKGKVNSTGQLGDVMQESIQAAMTVVRSRSKSLGIKSDFYENFDMHIHVPEGATPKDGPSAGISMCTAMVSILTKIPVRKDVAMTGEITLRGQVLPIGGLKEKLLAAKRAGIVDVIIPDENVSDLNDIADEVYEGINIHPVKWIDEVLQIALTSMPTPLPDEGDGSNKDSDGVVEPVIRKH